MLLVCVYLSLPKGDECYEKGGSQRLWKEPEGSVEDVKLGVRPKKDRDETIQTALGI